MSGIRIAFLSDLHLDVRRRFLLRGGEGEAAAEAAMAELASGARSSAEGADLVVLAGDIAGGTYGIEWAAQTFDQPVLYVAGNHEFYRHDHPVLLDDLRAAAGRTANVRFLEQDALRLTLAGRPLEVVGCTAWTDYALYGEAVLPEAMHRAATQMYDHHRISFGGGPFRPADALALHRRAMLWLDDALAAAGAGPVLVVTHHAPSPASIEPRFQNDSLSPAFASDLTALIRRHQPALWIHGHTHHNIDYAVGTTRVVTHQWGYPGEDVARGCKVVTL